MRGWWRRRLSTAEPLAQGKLAGIKLVSSELSCWLLHRPTEGDLCPEVAHDRDETSAGPGSRPPCSDGMCAAAAGAWRANEGDDAAPRGARAGERDVRMRASSCAPCAPCPRRHSPSPAERSPPGRARSRRKARGKSGPSVCGVFRRARLCEDGLTGLTRGGQGHAAH